MSKTIIQSAVVYDSLCRNHFDDNALPDICLEFTLGGVVFNCDLIDVGWEKFRDVVQVVDRSCCVRYHNCTKEEILQDAGG